MDVLTAMKERWSCRAFLDKPVPHDILNSMFEAAMRAPSGVNHQPWHVVVLEGEKKTALSEAIITARHAGIDQHPDYHYYSDRFDEPYRARRKACGIALYNALGIAREDMEKRKTVWEENYRFFGAPVGLIFYIEDYLETGSWMDLGMFIQNVMLAARAFGLETCPQAALAEYPDIVREHLGIEKKYHIACGMSLGYPDLSAAINSYRTEREPIAELVRYSR
ncbi:MAG: nitroreductase [Gammaproteobacteria bacterium CG11_big_fil_rev_8_21_14_0_20_46_22]|nr:MAG: nitroreductase [Gammaproteobacteria bacterium CG12_big_fil_rev_8_21_14_0_65_46_12]PIR11274.1 MAG: nitroreductase [Gammaproteobacteria bacterium CG11_big_fil_rev_8_21_14_0_20_46_22]